MKFLNKNYAFYSIVILLSVSAVFLRAISLPYVNDDMPKFYIPWYEYIVSHGGFLALKDSIGLYTPPNYYFLAAVSYLDGIVRPLYLIKTVPVVFDFVAAFVIYRISLAYYADERPAIVSALIFLNLPAVILESAYWGQYDIIFVTFLLATALAFVEGRPRLALIWFGIAISFKLPAIFLLPLIAVLLLNRRMSLFEVLLVPVAYAAMMLPAVLAGRPFGETLLVYFNQFDYAQLLVEDAPNPYEVVKRLHFVTYKEGVIAGIAVSIAAVGGAIFLFRSRIDSTNAQRLLLGAAFFTSLAPYLLPKMHDRYIFAGDVFAFAFVAVNWRAWPLVVLFKSATLLAYSKFLWSFRHGAEIGLLPMTGAILLVIALMWQTPPSAEVEPHPGVRLM